MEFSTAQIADILEGEIEGSRDLKINKLNKIEQAENGSITFLHSDQYEKFIYHTEASAVIVRKDFKPKNPVKATLIRVSDPYLSFAKLLEEYQKYLTRERVGIHKTASVAKSANIGNRVYIGANVFIGDDVIIGDDVKIYPNCYIGNESRIGDGCILYAGVNVYDQSVIGTKCVFHSGVVIGSHGFGFAPQKDGSYKDIPQLGNVVIGNNVSLGANTTIDCATLGSTIIKDGVKLDNLIQVGHNVYIGENTVVAAQSGISGSTHVGKNCILAGQVGLVGHIKIADNTTITAQSGVAKSITKEGTIVAGSPAFSKTDQLKSYSIFKSLPDLKRQINNLEEKIINLPALDKQDEYKAAHNKG